MKTELFENADISAWISEHTSGPSRITRGNFDYLVFFCRMSDIVTEYRVSNIIVFCVNGDIFKNVHCVDLDIFRTDEKIPFLTKYPDTF